MKQKSGIRNSSKARLDDSFTCLNLFYTAAPVHSPATIGNNFPCVDKLHGSLHKQNTLLCYYEKRQMLLKKKKAVRLREREGKRFRSAGTGGKKI